MIMKTGMALLLAGVMQPRNSACALDLEASLTRAIVNKAYQEPAADQLAQAQRLFQHTFLGDLTAAELQTNWVTLGFEFSVVINGEDSLWLLREPTGHESGRGWYLFRPSHHSSITLESPHARNDVHTGIIGLRLFLASQTQAYAASTITRHRADMAHLDHTFFQAFTLAFAQSCPTGLVVQLHGFEVGNHHGAEADIIASAGTATPELWFNDLVRDLKKSTPLRVLAYPQDIRELGAITNSQGQALQKNGHCHFLHLEFSLELRERLTRNSQLRHALLSGLRMTAP
jgi:hypothetical protein